MAGREDVLDLALAFAGRALTEGEDCLLYTSDAADEL